MKTLYDIYTEGVMGPCTSITIFFEKKRQEKRWLKSELTLGRPHARLFQQHSFRCLVVVKDKFDDP